MAVHPLTRCPSGTLWRCRLEEQLQEALAQRDPLHKPAIDIDTPADKTLKLLDLIMKGRLAEVTPRMLHEVRDAIIQAGDLRQPVNFNEQLMKNSQTVLDSEVSQSLIQLLSSRRPAKVRWGLCQEPTATLPRQTSCCWSAAPRPAFQSAHSLQLAGRQVYPACEVPCFVGFLTALWPRLRCRSRKRRRRAAGRSQQGQDNPARTCGTSTRGATSRRIACGH
jgi:hypothetical protein